MKLDIKVAVAKEQSQRMLMEMVVSDTPAACSALVKSLKLIKQEFK